MNHIRESAVLRKNLTTEGAMFLIRPHRTTKFGINSSVVRKIEMVLGKKIFFIHVKMSSDFFPHQSEKRRRCDTCVSKIK